MECISFFAPLSCVFVLVTLICITYLFLKNGVKSSVSSSELWRLGNSETERHGGELVVKVLMDHGVESIFTLIGGHISPILVAAERAGMRVIDTRHEATCVFAADAYARLSGKIGVAVVTAGPGLTNTITGVKNAQLAGSPVLLMSGATATLLKGRGALQDIDQMALMKSLCKYTVSVSRVKQIVPAMCKAIQKAMSELPGPVFIELPLDVLYPQSSVLKHVKMNQHPHGFMAKITNWYLEYYLHRLFADAFVPQSTKPLPLSIDKAHDHQIQACAALVRSSKKPLLLLGSQVVYPANVATAVSHAVKVIGIPCFASGMARGLLGKTHFLLCRHKRREALREADLIILAGVACDFRLSYGRDLNKTAKIIAINMDKGQLYKNSKIFWNYTIAVKCSVSDFLIRFSHSIQSVHTGYEQTYHGWFEHLQKRDLEADTRNRAVSSQKTDVHLNPISVLCSLEDAVHDNTILIADGGDFVATASYLLRPTGPLKWLDPGPFGTLGVGAGFALGAKACYPECDVVIIYGDGSVGFSIMEFDTFVRHNLPILAFVGNDACWTQIEREQVPMFKSSIACRLRFTDYHAVAAGMGAHGEKIDEHNIDNIDEILRSALDASRAGKSILLNVLIGKTDFRSGSISV